MKGEEMCRKGEGGEGGNEGKEKVYIRVRVVVAVFFSRATNRITFFDGLLNLACFLHMCL